MKRYKVFHSAKFDKELLKFNSYAEDLKPLLLQAVSQFKIDLIKRILRSD